MQRPGAQEVHVDQLLTSFSLKYTNPGYMGLEVFPEVKVTKQSDKYAVFGKEHLVVKPDNRAPGTEANEIFYSVDTSNTYFAEGHAHKEKVPDEDKENADDPFNLEIDATENISDSIDLNKEIRIKNMAYDASVTNADPAIKWDASGSDPIRDILQIAAKSVQNKSLKLANNIVIPYNVAVVLSWNEKIKDIVKYTDAGLLLKGDGIVLPKVLWGLTVRIPLSGYNTANLNQAASLSAVWGTNVLVYYRNPSPAKKHLSFGYTFVWKKKETTKWYEQKIKSTWIQTEEFVAEKIVCADCAYNITNCLT